MNFIELAHAPFFWTGLMTIIWVNVILSGDNAVVIALAARSLPEHQQSKAVFWGAGAAVILRVILTGFAVTLLQLPYLKLIGGLLLFWIAIKLLVPDEAEKNIKGHDNLFHAIRTILIADLIMSTDNVIAVAAAANGNILLVILGLLLSIPLVIFGATMLITLMERYPIIITIGAAMIGWVAGAMVVTDKIIATWIATNTYWPHIATIWPLGAELWGHIIGAITVLVIGQWLAIKIERSHSK
jgi:YjbE family integral membrane protein